MITARDARMAMLELRQAMVRKAAENRLLLAMIKRQLAETENLIRARPEPAALVLEGADDYELELASDLLSA